MGPAGYRWRRATVTVRGNRCRDRGCRPERLAARLRTRPRRRAAARPRIAGRAEHLAEGQRHHVAGRAPLDHRGLYEKLTGDAEQPRPMPAFIEGAGAGYDSAIGSRTWNRVSPGVDTTWMSPWCRETITR